MHRLVQMVVRCFLTIAHASVLSQGGSEALSRWAAASISRRSTRAVFAHRTRPISVFLVLWGLASKSIHLLQSSGVVSSALRLTDLQSQREFPSLVWDQKPATASM